MRASPIDIQIENSAKKKQPTASLFNLIIYAHEARRILYFDQLIHSILEKFPCRIIFIHAYESEKESFHLCLSSVMSGSGKGQVACDQITIKSSKNQLARVPSVMFPYILPDLPIYLLWGQSPFEEHLIFPSLQPYASRVIIDSECFDNLSLFCRQMEANLNLLKMEVMDINWALLSSWRDLLYRIFDRAEKVELLTRCKSILITYNNSKTETVMHPEIRSIYLQGWLASRLGYRYRQAEYFDDSLIISYFGENNPLVIALQPGNDSTQLSGSILNITITFTTGHSYSIHPKPSLSQAIIHESSLETCELPYILPLPNVYSGMTFLNEILHQNVGEHYRAMLHMISPIDHSSNPFR
jgi:Glucose-6-phosphate dehydrogenase subunit